MVHRVVGLVGWYKKKQKNKQTHAVVECFHVCSCCCWLPYITRLLKGAVFSHVGLSGSVANRVRSGGMAISLWRKWRWVCDVPSGVTTIVLSLVNLAREAG